MADKRKCGNTIEFDVMIFTDYMAPKGFLTEDTACHALFYYYLVARNAYEQFERDKLEYEGQVVDDPNYDQLFSSIAVAYGVEPQVMSKFW